MFNDPRIGTAATGGVALAVVFLLVHTFTYFTGVEVSADYQAALMTVLVVVGGMFVHRVQDDLDALHKLILARLGDQTARVPIVVSSPPPSAVAPVIQRPAAELLKQVPI